MFYFHYNTSVPLLPAVPCFWTAYIDRMSFGLAEGKVNNTDLDP